MGRMNLLRKHSFDVCTTKEHQTAKEKRTAKIGWMQILVTLIIICSVWLTGCKQNDKAGGEKVPQTLKDLAYDQGETCNTIYLEEDGVYKPYLVLSSDDQEKVLLLRKFVLDKEQSFNDYFGYYKDSKMDMFLNQEFLSCFDEKLQEQMETSKISITTMESLSVCGSTTEEIERKVFLLSLTQLDIRDVSFAAVEGTPLSYFKNEVNRLATKEDGTPSGWWLRSSYTVYVSTACAVSSDNKIAGVAAESTSGVRPAFCLCGDLNITNKEGILDGENVYVLENNDIK